MKTNILCGFLLMFFSSVFAAPIQKATILESYGKIPLSFTANEGQVDSRVKFTTTGSGASMFFTTEGTTFLLKKSSKEFVAAKQKYALENIGKNILTNPIEFLTKQKPEFGPEYYALKLRFMNENPNPAVVGEDQLAWNNNYFLGNNPDKWKTDVSNYAKLRLKNLYDGIDLVYYGNKNTMKYDFVVQAGADPKHILLAYDFGDNPNEKGSLSINENGELIVATPFGNIIERKPYCYQKINGKEVEIKISYKIANTSLHTFTFEAEQYDVNYPLVMDPELDYSTFLGGSSGTGFGVAVDGGGNAYITGYINSTSFPVTSGAYDQSYNGGGDVFVSKLNTAGSSLFYSTFMGGSGNDCPYGIALDVSGNVYITGQTGSSSFPVTSGAYVKNFNSIDDVDGFVSKLNSTGNFLVYSTFLGGDSYTFGHGITVDGSGNAFITGMTKSSLFPTTSGAYDQSHNGGEDVFVSKLNATGSSLLYSTFLGGSGDERAYRIVLDGSRNANITGATSSSSFPTTSGAYDQSHNGDRDVFVSKLNATGSSLLYSTFIGGSGFDYGYGIALDGSGNTYIAGYTESSLFPTTSGAYDPSFNGIRDAFVCKLDATGSSLLYSTFIGGNDTDESRGLALDGSGNAYITGMTSSSSFPTTSGAYDQSYNGGEDAFLCKLNATGNSLLYSTFLGGSNNDYSYGGIFVDSRGDAYITGYTESSNFPITSNAYDTSFNGNKVTFVSKFSFEKYGDVNNDGNITSFDGAKILRCLVKLDTLKNLPRDSIAADVSGEDGVTSYDAGLIFDYVAGLITKFPVEGGAAKISRGDIIAENRKLIIGKPQVQNNMVNIPLSVKYVQNLLSADLTLNFHPDKLKIIDVKSGDIAAKKTLFYNIEGNKVRIAMAGGRAAKSEGVLLNLQIEKTSGENDEQDLISIEHIQFNEDKIPIDVVYQQGGEESLPTEYKLLQNYPNPFNPETTIKFQLPEASQISLTVYNILGQQVKTLVNEVKQAGSYSLQWNGRNDAGLKVSSGIYICRIKAGTYVKNMKMVMLQ